MRPWTDLICLSTWLNEMLGKVNKLFHNTAWHCMLLIACFIILYSDIESLLFVKSIKYRKQFCTHYSSNSIMNLTISKVVYFLLKSFKLKMTSYKSLIKLNFNADFEILKKSNKVFSQGNVFVKRYFSVETTIVLDRIIVSS